MRVSNVSANVGLLQSNVTNLNFDVYSSNGLVSNLSSNLSNIESDLAEAFQLYGDAVSGNSQATTTLIAAGTTVGAGAVLNVVGKIFGFAQQKANQSFAEQTRTTVAEVFGSNNWDNITTSNGFSLTNNSNITQLQAQTSLMRSHTDTTSVRQIKINGNSSNIVALQSNTANLATAISIHSSNIGSLNQSVITIETDVNSLTSSLSDNSARITTVSGDLASNSARISTVTSDLASNVSRISSLENSGGMSSGTGVDQLNTITKSLQITSGWMDTGIQGTDLTSGTHIVQIYDVDDHTAGGGDYDEIYSGIMSWFSGACNSYEATEIHLTSAGHAPNDNHIYLRVLRTPYNNGTGRCKLQIRRDSGMSGSYTYTFKFRRLI